MNLKLFLCCHRSYEIIPPLYNPIQCGAAINTPIAGTFADNAGENISSRNREYCELTAHYYAWKNVLADYYGFCHYRRFFCADIISRYPYIAKGRLSDSDRKKLLNNESYWRGIISQYEIIVPRSEDMGLSVKAHYTTSKFHYEEDLNLFMDILRTRAPRLCEAANEYLSQNRQYFCNMFIMKNEYFYEYCSILFSILEEFDARKNPHGDYQSDRTDGFLGEIFTGIYVQYCYKKGTAIKELPRVDVNCSAGKRLSYLLFPPESKRRFIMKRIVKRMKGN